MSQFSERTTLQTETGDPVATGSDEKLRVGQDALSIYDPIDGAAVNTLIWLQATSTMTIVQASGTMTLNAGSSLAAGASAQIATNKRVPNLVEYPIYVQFRARVVPQANAVIEFGFFTATGTTPPTDGCFLRWTGASIALVIAFNSVETTLAVTAALSPTVFYNFELEVREDVLLLSIEDPNGSVAYDATLPIPQGNSSPYAISHVAVSARVYDAAVTAAAAQLVIGSVVCSTRDLARGKPWSDTLAGMSRNFAADPATFAQAAGWTNSTIPATAALSNTVPSYATLGGQFMFAPVAGAETDYALFAYQVPGNYQAYITGVMVTAGIFDANNGGTVQLMEWALAVNSNAASLATGAPYPPFRVPIGSMAIPNSQTEGELALPPNLIHQFRTPIVCDAGRYVHIILRIPRGATVGGAFIRGSVMLNGYFE